MGEEGNMRGRMILAYRDWADAPVGLMYTAVWNAAMLQTDDVKKDMLSGLKRTKTSFEKL